MLEEWCRALRPHWKKKIIHLNGEEKGNFENLRSLIMNVYYKKEEYQSIFQTIRDIFDDLITSGDIEPGTVSGYVAGCIIEPENTCGVICSQNSIPLPGGMGVIGCHYNVIRQSINENNEILFEKIYTNEESKDAILYISTQSFHLTSDQKEYLKANLHIEKIHVIHYKIENGTVEYKEIWPDFRTVDEITENAEQQDIEGGSVFSSITTTVDRYIWFSVIIVVLLFSIVIGCIVWYRRKL